VNPDQGSFDAAIRAHDRALAERGADVWIGAEPTFTDRWSEAPEWLSEALGDSKQLHACRVLRRLRQDAPGSMILRTLGRQYPHESRPRWSFGLYRRRDGAAVAAGLPGDPLSDDCDCEAQRVLAFWNALCAALDGEGWSATGFRLEGQTGLRVLFRCDGQRPFADPARDVRLARVSLHEGAIPPHGLVDELARDGLYLVSIGCAPTGPGDCLQPCLELPGFDTVEIFLAFVRRVARAVLESGLSALVWRGFPPPVDQTVAWTTLTPDPAVLEVNGAPAASVAEFLEVSRTLFDAARDAGLEPYRLQYNGEIGDSGGGGQFTLGGPSPQRSPFFVAPQLLARMVTYFNRHPALSYWFAPLYVGSSSQSPRADENVLESFNELQVALSHLASSEAPRPEFIWRSLSPFLVDTSGNPHRSELNIEKLWNPWLPGRGCSGLVEFRAFRMARDPEAAAAIAALLRALAAMLSRARPGEGLIEWGSRLHDQFALPFYLRRDLQCVLADLEDAGLGLAGPISERLLADDWRRVGRSDCDGCRIEVDQAVEFWPLLGDVAAQVGGTRLVDASTTRLQLLVRVPGDAGTDLGTCQLRVGRYRVPLRAERDAGGSLLVTGLRYRAFVPAMGLHPGLPAQQPVVLTLVAPGGRRALRMTLHHWQPQALPYPGLPESLAEARRRTEERFVVEEVAPGELPEALPAPPEALSDYCFDLRRTAAGCAALEPGGAAAPRP
jgi:uncharacterized protein (DUF2126 family)